MKKITALLLSITMITSLSACGEKKEETASTTEATTVTTKATTKATTKEVVTEPSTDVNKLDLTIEFDETLSYKVSSNWLRDDSDKIQRFYLPDLSVFAIAKLNEIDDTNTTADLVAFAETIKSDGSINDYTFTTVSGANAIVGNSSETIQYIFIANSNIYAIMLSNTMTEEIKNNIINAVIITEVPSTLKENNESSEKDLEFNITLGMKNALSKAKDYLDTMPFSYEGLIKQLEFEGYTNEEALYGVDNCGADWMEQAAKKAQDYLDTMEFSRQGLIDQLIFEGFTEEQAEYGVTAVGY